VAATALGYFFGPPAPDRAILRVFAILGRSVMPKMKTHSGAKKRFKLTAKGKVKARHAFTSHILEKKSPKHKRHLGKDFVLSPHDQPRVKTLLGAKKK
jgi:large subunit ribosomal protein L35